MQTSPELDMRTLVPIERHKKLLQLFKELPVGKHFVFINDHDPIPLYYEFRSVYGDVVGWEYLNRGGREWKVKVTRTEASQGREFSEINTLLDLRKAPSDEWKQIVFHRYGMMQVGDTMEIIAAEDPVEIHGIFIMKFEGQHSWIYKKQEPGEYVIHVLKKSDSGSGDEGYAVTGEFDLRPFPPAKRHDMFYRAFADCKPGEAFDIINDHDPKPLYYQMEAESKEPFRWEYLQQGPETWKVRVIKTRG
ncbi:MAG: DUF2249 domain-containing protein [Bacteroidia bacterium]|nr:DUF2249 domain-containing protein [Bacteroidia bacterium]